jgi:hypothetical protein
MGDNNTSDCNEAAAADNCFVEELNQTVLELDFRGVKFLFFPR